MNIECKSVLFLGIGGVSMHQLAIAYKNMGINVYGYDVCDNLYTKKCEECGILVTKKFKKEFLNVDLCIKTGAIKNNKYLTELNKRGVKIIDRAEALSFLASKFKCVIAVAGTHGKSTTASLIYEIMRVAGLKVSSHIGADVFAARFDVNDEYLVVEACEYNRSFLSLNPTISVVTNVEAEHLDSYGSLFNLKNAFSVFLKRGNKRFVGYNKTTNYLSKVKNVEFVRDLNLDVNPKIKGEYNLKNISLAAAVCKSLGIDNKIIINAINEFKGIPRRYEFVGLFNNKKVYIDYGHHPTEILSFYETFKQENSNNLVIFQPHTYSRTKLLLKDFISVLSKIENLIIFKEYPAREKAWQGMSAYELYEKVKNVNSNVKYCANKSLVVKIMQNFNSFAFVGAGNINLLARNIVQTN